MREEKIARSLSGALAVLAAALVPLYLFWGPAFARTMLFYGLGSAAIGIAVAWLLGRRHAALQLPAAALPAAALALLVPIDIPGGGIARYIVMGAGALLALWAERLSVTTSAGTLKTGALTAPLAVLLLATALLLITARTAPDMGEIVTLIVTLGVIWFAVAAFVMNRLSLRQAARANEQNGVPSGVRRSGTAGILVFVLATFLLACIGPIVRFIGDAIKMLFAWAIKAFVFLTNLFAPKGSGEGPPLMDPEELLPKAEGSTSPLAELLSNIIMVLVLLATLFAIGYGLYKLFPKLWKRLMERLRGLFSAWREDDEYSDRSESLMTIRQAVAGAGEKLKKFARRFRRRPRIGDFGTNAAKARFLFREFLHNLIAAGHEPPPGATATDIARPAPSLARAYNRARYGEEEPGDREIEQAREEVKL